MGVLLALLPLLVGGGDQWPMGRPPRPARAGTIVQNVDISYSYPGMAGYGPGVYLEVYGFDFIDVPFPTEITITLQVASMPGGLPLRFSWEPDPGLSGCPLSQMRPSPGAPCYPLEFYGVQGQRVIRNLDRSVLAANGRRWRVRLLAETLAGVPAGSYRVKGSVNIEQRRLFGR